MVAGEVRRVGRPYKTFLLKALPGFGIGMMGAGAPIQVVFGYLLYHYSCVIQTCPACEKEGADC